MSEPINILALWLDGPMQSWGHESRFKRRTTLPYPTRSGVVGMICAAMGISRSDNAPISQLTALTMETRVYPRRKRTGDPLNTRWTDFHTVGGGFHPKTQRDSMVPKAEGKARDPVLTHREYLADVRFGVLLWGAEREFMSAIDARLRDPVWGVWLGRKCCIPSAPIAMGLFDSRSQALDRLAELAGVTGSRQITEVSSFEDGTDTLTDVPLDFLDRSFTVRRVRDEPLNSE